MKRCLTFMFFIFLTQIALADFNTYETRQDAYDRRSYENYQTYQQNGYNQPLGGYNRPINDDGGRQYGSSTGNYGMNSINSNNSRNYQRNSNGWNSFN